MDYRKELEVAKKAAVVAGAAILEIYGEDDFHVEYKADASPITEADKRANGIIVDLLREKFPDYAILAEESEDDDSRHGNDFCFVVDPLDGTKEFIKRNGQFTVNIALAYKHKAVMGVIYIPVTKELYFAIEGEGSYYQPENADPVRIRVSDRTSDIRLMVSLSHSDDRIEGLIERNHVANVIKMGSSIKGCLIARGESEAYYRFGPTMEWDTAAMQCIVEQAGAVFRQTDGSEMLYNRENPVNAMGFYILNKLENALG
ncbi:MAG: 3'(2'),5'-bisphosphate nucleotidase CysQ [Peptococcaceae bacterium]|jgi:3'(2'), 5'-bisphosphate nucleotidase|nr:3'(2'),5'-bisphosphate nucleotidase CysQ [Peptococcaceae bacterium]